MPEVLCLRPRDDFTRLGVVPPATLSVRYLDPSDAGLGRAMLTADALVIPAVGRPPATSLFEHSAIRLVQVTGAGVDRVNVDDLAALGISLANTPGGSANAVAEYVIAAVSAFLRQLPGCTDAIRAGHYARHRARIISSGLDEIAGLTVGIVGLGAIGQVVAERCLELGAQVIHFDPASPGRVKGSRRVDMAGLLAGADVVSLHVPLTQSTRHLIGRTELEAMKPEAILVNAARGGVVDEMALARALEQGRIGGAVVDVFSKEPPTMDNPLLSLAGDAALRLILTPHIAGVTRRSWARMFRMAWDNVESFLCRGKGPRHVVNPPDDPATPATSRHCP